MRQGYNNKIILFNEQRIGINLGADYCAEHEWGIEGIKESFLVGRNFSFFEKMWMFFSGKKPKKYGLDRRIISCCPKNLFWFEKINASSSEIEKKLFSGLYFYVGMQTPPKRLLTDFVRFDESLVTGWSDNGFYIASSNIEEIEYIKLLFDNFKKKNIVIYLGNNALPFENKGLIIAIADKLSTAVVEDWKNKDIDNEKLYEEFHKTNIEVKLAAANKKYYALKPRREKNGSLIFWLNPMEQNKYNFGWYSLQDLENWANDKGRILSKK